MVYFPSVLAGLLLLYNYVKGVKKLVCALNVALSSTVSALLVFLHDAVLVAFVCVCEALAKSKPW